jgi:phenylalanyl-tRNA synthetase alpha chain
MDPEAAILTALSTTSIPDTYEFATQNSLDHNTVVGISKSLEGDAYVTLREISTRFFVLSSEAESILENGSQEVLVWNALRDAGEAGLSMQELQEKVGNDVCKIGMGNCLKNKWAKKEKDGRLIAVGSGEVKDEVREMLGKLKEGGGGAGVLDDKVSL